MVESKLNMLGKGVADVRYYRHCDIYDEFQLYVHEITLIVLDLFFDTNTFIGFFYNSSTLR